MAEYHIGEALKNMVAKSTMRGHLQTVQIEEIWENLMGKTIAKYTNSIKIINTTLFIATTVGPLKNELMYQKKNIIERVNEAFGETIIKEVVISS
jgi:hypothetical protein